MPGDPTGLDEVIALAEAHKVATMICHIAHSAMGGIGVWLSKIDAANARGARITTETLSYLAGGTSIAADVFVNRDWRAIFDIDYEDVQWVPTGEWLDEERFLCYQRSFPPARSTTTTSRKNGCSRPLNGPMTFLLRPPGFEPGTFRTGRTFDSSSS